MPKPQKKICYYLPLEISEETREILGRAMKCPPCVSAEMIQLKKFYEGDPRLINEIFERPPNLPDQQWSSMKKYMLSLNMTRATLKVLSSSVYGGEQVREIQSKNENENAFVNEFLNSPAFSEAMKNRVLGAYLFGTQISVPTYDNNNGFSVLNLDAVKTSLVRDFFNVPIGIVEFNSSLGDESFFPYDDIARSFSFNLNVWDFAKVFVKSGFGTVAKQAKYSSWTDYDFTLNPWVISRGNVKTDDQFSGISLVRELPRVDTTIATTFFASSMAMRMGAQKLVAVMAEEAPEVQQNAGFTQLKMGQNDKITSIDMSSESEPIMKNLDSLISIQSFFSGIPCSANARSHQSATASEMQNISLTSQVGILAAQSASEEYEIILRLLQSYRMATGQPTMTRRELIENYKPKIKIVSALDTISDLEKSQIAKNYADVETAKSSISENFS